MTSPCSGYLVLILAYLGFVFANPFPLRTTLSTACAHLEVPAGTIVTGGDWEYDGALLLEYPNNTAEMVKPCRTPEELKLLRSLPGQEDDALHSFKLRGNGPPNQWLAWYNANFPIWNNGGTQFSTTFSVPPLPSRLTANLALFPGLQPTYNPTNYDFILQPVLQLGSWMDGGSHTTWSYNAVVCISSAGYCIYSKMFNVAPQEVLYGEMVMTNSSTGRYCWLVNATSMSTGMGNSITYCTKYMITFAFATIEHNPIGPISHCDSLPPGKITFENIVVQPPFMGGWQGTLGGDASCGIAVDTFPFGDSVSLQF